MNFFLFLAAFFLKSDYQNELTITQNGWLVYRYFDNLAFLPIKDQSVTPTYENFFTEEKGDGQRMNNNYSAPPKLLLAKRLLIGVYYYDPKSKKDTFAGKEKFYIQPVKYVYKVKNTLDDTADYENGITGWTFQIRGMPIKHNVYYFIRRAGTVYYLTTKDSMYALRGGRRKDISIYPPH